MRSSAVGGPRPKPRARGVGEDYGGVGWRTSGTPSLGCVWPVGRALPSGLVRILRMAGRYGSCQGSYGSGLLRILRSLGRILGDALWKASSLPRKASLALRKPRFLHRQASLLPRKPSSLPRKPSSLDRNARSALQNPSSGLRTPSSPPGLGIPRGAPVIPHFQPVASRPPLNAMGLAAQRVRATKGCPAAFGARRDLPSPVSKGALALRGKREFNGKGHRPWLPRTTRTSAASCCSWRRA